MTEAPNLYQITDRAVKDIAQKLAGMEMHSAVSAPIDDSETHSLVITTRGDYELTLVFCTDLRVMRAITSSMKRGGQPDEEEIAAYMKEFFNILCGHVVSALNRSIHASARFGIPLLLEGPFRGDRAGQRGELCYRCRYGPVRVLVLYRGKPS